MVINHVSVRPGIGDNFSLKLTQPLKIDHPKKTCHLPTIHFQMPTLSFGDIFSLKISGSLRAAVTFEEEDGVRGLKDSCPCKDQPTQHPTPQIPKKSGSKKTSHVFF